MGDTEEYFPRGGKKPTNKSFKQGGNFLGVPERVDKKKKKPKKKSEGDDGYLSDDNANELFKSTRNHIVGLSYKTLKEGVLMLARVRNTHGTKLVVMMPGRMMGSVMACHISEPYNKMLEAYVNDQVDKVKELPQMFRPGQYIAVKVLEVDGDKVMLTAMPQHVNAGKKQADLHKSTVLQAAVSSIEDHGYVMDIGIPNTRAFLPKTEVNPELDLDIGMIAWCGIKSVSSSESSVVTLSSMEAVLQHGVTRHKPDSPLLPGTALQFTVEEPMDNGIQGQVFEDTKAYIMRQHIDNIKGKRPALGQKIIARVLYVMPTRKAPFLTMKNIFESVYPDLAEEQKFKDGDIVEDAQVLKVTGRGVLFRLGEGCTGAMTMRRIHVDEDLSDEDVVAKSYPIGSTHKVRILCYNLLDFTYSVSDQASVLNQKYFSLDHLSVGQIVDATVKYITDTHLVLDLGRFTGMVPRAHITEAGLSRDPKKPTYTLAKHKYKVGQEVRGRVLTVDPSRGALCLTMKPSLLAPDLEVLSSHEQAQVGKGYTGIIKFIRDFIIVAFFDNVTAYVPRHYVTKDPVENLMDAFHVGQIVNCTILSIDIENKKMTGSLTTVPFWPEKRREKGEKRKPKANDTQVPEKKKKLRDNENALDSSEDNEVEQKKKKKGKANDMSENTEPEKKKKKNKNQTETQDDALNADKKKDKKSKVPQEISQEIKSTRKRSNSEKSSESDAIETDIGDEEQMSTEETMYTNHVSVGKFVKRVTEETQDQNAKEPKLKKEKKKVKEKDTKTEGELISKPEKKKKGKDKQAEALTDVEPKTKQEKKKKELNKLEVTQETEPQTKKRKNKQDAQIIETTEETESQTKHEKKKKKKAAEDEHDKLVENDKDSKTDTKVETLKPVLDVPSAKEFWNAKLESASKKTQEEDSSSSDDEETEQPKKKRKKLSVKEKLEKARAEEERIRELERKAIESESQPRSSDQFERALLANPDCSQLWIAYMAFHLQATEIEKARAVAKKALNTISFREEQEKLNVWLALINLENRFGTKESQQKTLEDAIQMNDPFKIHSKLLDIYVETSKHQELSSLVDLMMRKYRREPSAYVLAGGACYKLGLVEKARHVMQKAVAVLEKKEHVSVLVQFALLERSHGMVERAEALFEQVVAVYPARVDVAAAYLDMLAKSADVDRIRQVLERMTSHKLPARKMKVLYKKWVEIEEKMGDEEHVEKVRQKAMEYIKTAQF